MVVIYRDTDSGREFWDGGMWKPARSRARVFPSHQQAHEHAAAMQLTDYQLLA